DREFEGDAVVDLPNDDGKLGQAGTLCRAPASLAGDDLKTTTGCATHDDRLHDAVLADRLGKIRQLRLAEITARVARIGTDELDRHAAVSAYARRRCRRVFGRPVDFPDQCGEAASETFS